VDQSAYKQQLDHIKSVHDQQRYLNRVGKIVEQNEQQEKNKVLDQYNVLKKQEDSELKSYLQHTNQQMLHESHLKKQEEFIRKRIEDQELLDRLKVTNDEEARRKLQEKQEYLEAQNKFLEYRTLLKESEKVQERQKVLDYSRQCEENGRLQDAKDRMYKQFFANFDQSLNARAKLYLDKILEEEIKKDMMMRNWETNGNDPVFKQMSEERIRQEVERRLKDASEIKEFNRFMIEQHERDKERQVEVQKMELEFRKKKEEENRLADERKRQEERQNQKLYGDTLSYQANIVHRMRNNYGSMTEQEKKMNKLDLRSYKEGDSTIHSMIPGISNILSVGSSPLVRKGLANPLMQTPGLGTSVLSQSLVGTNAQDGIQSANQTPGGLNKSNSSGALLKGSFNRYDQHPIKDSIHSKSKQFCF